MKSLTSRNVARQERSQSRVLCFDIGGSGIKAMLVDPRGKAVSERVRVETPRPASPSRVLSILEEVARELSGFERVSVGFPGVVVHGITLDAPNLSPLWNHYPLMESLRARLDCPVRVANDADVQGLGVVKGEGIELLITLGTGVGSALFLEGVLFPNLEMGHHPFRKGETYEEQLCRSALDQIGTRRWNRRIRKMVENLREVFHFDALYLGGGNSKKVQGKLPANVLRVGNQGGLLGGSALWELNVPALFSEEEARVRRKAA